MNLNSSRPLGNATTVLDVADRDEMDDDLFPLTAQKSWFTRDSDRRYLNFSPVIQEFVHKGTAAFGNRLVFEIGSVKSCDLLFAVALQVRLGHWLPESVVAAIAAGTYTYDVLNGENPWFYANSLGSAMITKCDLLLEDQVLETCDGDFANAVDLLFSDVNTQFGVGVDALGRAPFSELVTWPEYRVFPTTNGILTAILPFSFQRIRLRNGLPLSSIKEGALRVAITLRPFHECVRLAYPNVRTTCDDTPLGKTFVFNVEGGGSVSVVAAADVPAFADARLVTYGMIVDGKLRQALVHAPFDRMYREVQTFRFDEPKKYVVTTPSQGVVSLQLPLEVIGPIEEFIWFIRRKAVAVNNEWTNWSNRLEFEYNSVFRPFESMLVGATLQVNGINLIQADGEFFRKEIAKRHRGGIVAYNNFIYGYTFSQTPGQQNPGGWMNASRSQDVRLRLDVRPPGGSEDLEFEVVVFSLALNWVRFQGGLANKVFSS